MEVVFSFAMVVGLMLIGVPIAVSLGMSSIVFSAGASRYIAMPRLPRRCFRRWPGIIRCWRFRSLFWRRRSCRRAVWHNGSSGSLLRWSGTCRAVWRLRASSPVCCLPPCRVFPGNSCGHRLHRDRGMRQVGYTKEFAAGVIANAGTLGILIPPSIVMVVYASATDVSVGRMFLAGVIPGLLAGTMLMVTIYIIAKVKNLPKGEWRAGAKSVQRVARRAGACS